MLEFQAEGLCKSADRLDEAALRRAMAGQEILQSTALAFDTQRRLHFTLGGLPALMEYEECAEGVAQGTVRDIAILTRVGRPTCFLIQSCEATESGQLVFHLSRTEAQRRCRREYLDELPLGSVIHCTVTHIEPFGAFCDVGCGISALLPIDCLSVSRISSPADRVSVGQQLLCAVKSRDPQGRLVLTLRELLGT